MRQRSVQKKTRPTMAWKTIIKKATTEEMREWRFRQGEISEYRDIETDKQTNRFRQGIGKVPTSTSGEDLGSVSCPRTFGHADEGTLTSDLLTTIRWLYHRATATHCKRNQEFQKH